MIRAQIVEAARSWLDTPFQHQGRIKGHAVDCAGLVVGVAHELELSDFDAIDYPKIPDGKTMEQILQTEMQPIAYDETKVGAVLHFAFFKYAQHLAIITQVLPRIIIIHSYEHNKKVVEHGLDSIWRDRIRGVYRFHGIN